MPSGAAIEARDLTRPPGAITQAMRSVTCRLRPRE